MVRLHIVSGTSSKRDTSGTPPAETVSLCWSVQLATGWSQVLKVFLCRSQLTSYHRFVPVGVTIFILTVTVVAVNVFLNPLLGSSQWYYGHCIWSLYLFANIMFHYAGGTLQVPGMSSVTQLLSSFAHPLESSIFTLDSRSVLLPCMSLRQEEACLHAVSQQCRHADVQSMPQGQVPQMSLDGCTLCSSCQAPKPCRTHHCRSVAVIPEGAFGPQTILHENELFENQKQMQLIIWCADAHVPDVQACCSVH